MLPEVCVKFVICWTEFLLTKSGVRNVSQIINRVKRVIFVNQNDISNMCWG